MKETLILFDRESLTTYNKLKMNNIELKNFENVSQVWLLIIKKSLYQSEYNDNLSSVIILYFRRLEILLIIR